ncbi:hypothetical protein RN001_014526 [Aquatica leii]|uniref:Uncharacterized protein n=1 Tax=Aquatica leii TaxID=1421715 RepID=A0AAN7PPG4_9COLE|nr:hypothetical protein RN001_014526 [Aquatica leii]
MESGSENFDSTTFDQFDPIKDCYPMSKEKLGNVYIFNHITFDDESLGARYGSMKDCRDLEELFQNLKFDVTVYNDLVYKDILEKLSNIAEMDYSNFDCLVIFVLTHRINGKVCARDTEYYPDVYWKQFSDKLSFMHKPKLIFIQASRGDEADDGVRVTNAVNTIPTTYPIPAIPDILLMYSCYDGFYSWRSSVTGSSFVQCICKEFNLHQKNTDLLTLLTFVNRRMSIYFIKLPDTLNDAPQINNFRPFQRVFLTHARINNTMSNRINTRYR